jgi:uncharacterized protein
MYNSRMSLNQSELSFETAMQRLATQLQPEQIILFGSKARGNARADSNYDVLIVANGEPHELARQASRLLRGRRFALDLLALSREHIEKRLATSTLLKTIMREGKVLYEA